MAVWQIALFSKWRTVGGRNEMAIAIDYPADWSDVTSQSDANIKNRSAQYGFLALGRVNDATLAAITADAHYLILARYEMDVDTPSFDNRQSVVTAVQRTAFINYFAAEFGIDVSKVPVIAAATGRTRAQVIRDIITDLRALR